LENTIHLTLDTGKDILFGVFFQADPATLWGKVLHYIGGVSTLDLGYTVKGGCIAKIGQLAVGINSVVVLCDQFDENSLMWMSAGSEKDEVAFRIFG
jgi:hypothetical protein